MRDAFLLGSGVSTPIAPSTAELTQEAFEGLSHYRLQSNERWEWATATTTVRGDERAAQVRALMQELATRIDHFYSERPNPAGCLGRVVNYEDIGFVADTIVSTLTLERDDPAVADFIASVMASTGMARDDLLEAADDTLNYLRDVVHSQAPQLRGSDPKPPCAAYSLATDDQIYEAENKENIHHE